MVYFRSIYHPHFLVALSQFGSSLSLAHCFQLLSDALFILFGFLLSQIFFDEFVYSLLVHFRVALVWLGYDTAFLFLELLVCYLNWLGLFWSCDILILS